MKTFELELPGATEEEAGFARRKAFALIINLDAVGEVRVAEDRPALVFENLQYRPDASHGLEVVLRGGTPREKELACLVGDAIMDAVCEDVALAFDCGHHPDGWSVRFFREGFALPTV